jgi:hypothetical protein
LKEPAKILFEMNYASTGGEVLRLRAVHSAPKHHLTIADE